MRLWSWNDLNEKYQSKVLVVDSLLACGAQGMLFLKALENKKLAMIFKLVLIIFKNLNYVLIVGLYTNDLSQLC